MTHPHTILGWFALASSVSTSASLVCNVLPNDKYLAEYPRLQRAYRTAIAFSAALALNIRHCLPSLDIAAPAIGITKPARGGQKGDAEG